ncbi:conserved hypothetical protein [Desulfatibacillum aliphaticivorans]|uniref:Uncharacterized protein n=1 Tax=Desulfatibacillum aliphaticivorans TaxID=218208 RepID=B8FAU3_DESAL|nr:hypothetical protein [Desulfatibacillum aliphaticivorans]ACL04029.1 conserved hypothetical protein [Desulfatibacillum aliphaticivorans]
MSSGLKIFFASLMSLALGFGYLDYFVTSAHSFERLHIFLFNLCSGGTIILLFSEEKRRLTLRTTCFLILGIGYAILAFLEMYITAMIVSVIMAGIVESIRMERFSVFPWGFVRKNEPVSAKFHQASLLCLSMSLFISTAVILNNQFMHWIYLPKLTLNVFFLGFSFPSSLITMSLIFSYMEKSDKGAAGPLKELGFWAINLGVIIFFIFIIFEQLAWQVVVTLCLFAAVIMILGIHMKLGLPQQQKQFLTSGLGFLLFTAVTGIAYIFLEIGPEYASEKYRWLLRLHAFASLYGWNLCGLAVIARYYDFPISLNSKTLIGWHWFVVIGLAPIGHLHPMLAFAAVGGYIAVLYTIFFTHRLADPGPI